MKRRAWAERAFPPLAGRQWLTAAFWTLRPSSDRTSHNGYMSQPLLPVSLPLPLPEAPSRDELTSHLVRTRITGDVATPRENNLSHYRKLANGDRHYWLGLELGDRWADEQDVLAVMAERCGVNDDPEYRYGPGHHRPGADRGRAGPVPPPAAQGGRGAQRVLFATGHPGGAARRARRHGRRAARGRVRDRRASLNGFADEGVVVQFCEVAVLRAGRHPVAHPLPRADGGRSCTVWSRPGPLPDLVVADHGWAGCAAQHGLTRSGTPTATTRRSSWARPRARWR